MRGLGIRSQWHRLGSGVVAMRIRFLVEGAVGAPPHYQWLLSSAVVAGAYPRIRAVVNDGELFVRQ